MKHCMDASADYHFAGQKLEIASYQDPELSNRQQIKSLRSKIDLKQPRIVRSVMLIKGGSLWNFKLVTKFC